MKKTAAVVIGAISAGVLLGLAVFGMIKFLGKEPQMSSVPLGETASELNGCYIEDFFAYSGEYPENGSFDTVKDVAALKLKNNSEHDIKYAEITVKSQSGDYVFLATTWLAGTEMTVLEQSGAKLYDKFSFVSAEITAAALFDEAPSMHGESFEVRRTEDGFSVKNVSGEDIPGTVTLYFKACDENGFFGGITCKADLEGLAAGEEKTVYDGLPTSKELKAVFITAE